MRRPLVTALVSAGWFLVAAGWAAAAPERESRTLETVARRLVSDLVPSAAGFVARARDIVQSAARAHGDAPLAGAVERAWAEHFSVAAVEAQLQDEVLARLSPGDAAALASWDESDAANRLAAGRASAPEPPSASLDVDRLEGEDRARYELARRLVEACDVLAGSYGTARQVVVAASLTSLRLLGIPEDRIAARRLDVERMFDAELASGREEMREAVLASTFHGGRELRVADLVAEVEHWHSAAGKSRCAIQSEALAAALVARLDSFPAAVAALPPLEP